MRPGHHRPHFRLPAGFEQIPPLSPPNSRLSRNVLEEFLKGTSTRPSNTRVFLAVITSMSETLAASAESFGTAFGDPQRRARAALDPIAERRRREGHDVPQ